MITITFASLELSNSVTRYTVIDGGFPLDYDGNTYLNDGLVVALDKTVISAELANVTQNITLFLDNDVKNAIQDDSYRNKRAKIFKGEWDPSTSTLSEVQCIYEGLIDTHNTPLDDGTVEFIISSLISPLRRPSDNISLQILHNQRLNDGVYGFANLNTVDTFLRNAGQSYQDFTLGASEYRAAVTKPMYMKVRKNMFGNHKRKYIGEEQVSAEIQETPGSQLENPASYQPARVYGISGVNAAIVAAWNHSPDNNFSDTKSYYGSDWRGFEDPESVHAIRPDTRFGTIVYLVHAGEVENLRIYLDDLNGDVESRSLDLTSGDTSIHYLKDEYRDENQSIQNHKYAAVEVLWGSESQLPPTSWINTSNGEIDTNFRGIGYVLVGVTMEASRDGAITTQIPQLGFQVKQTKSVSISTPAYVTTAIASLNNFSYDNTTPYSSYSFYVDNTFEWLVTNTRDLQTNQTFKSAFANSVINLTVDSLQSSDLSVAYGVSSSTTRAYNFADGLNDLSITQGSNSAKFKVASASRSVDGSTYSLWLGGVKEETGTIDLSQNFTFEVQELERSGAITPQSTRVPQQHPARVLVDYLTDAQVGPGLSFDDLDIESFIDCQENATKIPQYINGVMQGKDTFVEYVQDIADSANLTIYQEGDKIKCRFRRPVSPSDVAVTFNENNSSNMNLINFRNEDKFNEFVLVTNLQKVSNVRAPKITGHTIDVRDTNYLSQDNAIRSIGDFTSEWLTLFFNETVNSSNGSTSTTLDERDNSDVLDSYKAYARFLMDVSRFYEEIELTTTYSIAKDFTIGTVFDVENDLYGFTGNNIRRYEVVDYADNHDGTISLVGQRHSNAIFGLEDDFSNNEFATEEPVVVGYTSQSQTAIPSEPNLTAVWEPNSRRIDLSWTIPTNEFNVTHYQVQEKANSENEWTTISEQLVTSDRVFSRAIVERGGIYKYRVRALTPGGMINGPFSTTQYVRLDLAFGDNKPEQQRVIITGNRSNASVPSSVPTTVTIGLPTDFEAAPADQSGTGATSNIGSLNLDLDVDNSSFEAAASDSASGNTAVSNTPLPGTPSGGNYEIVDTFISSATGTASQNPGTVGTHALTNGAGNVVVTSDFLPALTGVYPASGTSTAAITSQALSNGAGTVTVSSNFVAGSIGEDQRYTEHSSTTNFDGTLNAGINDSTPTNISGFSGLNLTFATETASATTTTVTTAGVYSQTYNSDIVRTVRISGGTVSETSDIVSETNFYDTGGTATASLNLPEGGSVTVSYSVSISGGGPYGGTMSISAVTLDSAAISAGYAKVGLGAVLSINGGTSYSYGPGGNYITTAITADLTLTTPLSLENEIAGKNWTDNAASFNTSTGVITFPSQTRYRYTLTNGSSVDINDVVFTIASSTAEISTLAVSDTFNFYFNSLTNRSWSVETRLQEGTFTLPQSTGTLEIDSDFVTAKSNAAKNLLSTIDFSYAGITDSVSYTNGRYTNGTVRMSFYEGTFEDNTGTIKTLSVPSGNVPLEIYTSRGSYGLIWSDTTTLPDGTYMMSLIDGDNSSTTSYQFYMYIMEVENSRFGFRRTLYVSGGGSAASTPYWSGSWLNGLHNSTQLGLQSTLHTATDMQAFIACGGSTISQTGRSDVSLTENFIGLPLSSGSITATGSVSYSGTVGTVTSPIDLSLTVNGTSYVIGTVRLTSSLVFTNSAQFNLFGSPSLNAGVSTLNLYGGGFTANPSSAQVDSFGNISATVNISLKVRGIIQDFTASGGVVDTSAGYTGSSLVFDTANGEGTMPQTSRVQAGNTSYLLTRTSGVDFGVGLKVNGVSQPDDYDALNNPIQDWSVAINSASTGSTSYSLTRASFFDSGPGLVVDGTPRDIFYSEQAVIKPWYAEASKPATGTSNYTFNPDSAFTNSRSLTVGGVVRAGTSYSESGALRDWSATATRPQSGNTTYTLTRATGFADGQGWTIGGTPESTDVVVKTASANGINWSIDVSRPQSGGTVYELAGGPANLGIELDVGGITLTELSRSHTFADNVTNRTWSATFAPTTFSLEVDPNDVVYVGNSYEIISQAVTKGADEDDTLTEIANAVTAMDTNITWDSTISTNGTTGNREITIDLGTTSNIGFDIALGGKNSKNPNITDIETLGAGVNFSSYTLTSPDGGSTLNFNGFTIDATVADRNTVINEAVRQVDVNAEAPKDFLAESDGNSLIFTARTTGTSAGQWNFAWNHGSSTGNLRAKTYETDADSTSSADNVDAEVVREGVVDGSVNNTSFPSGTYDSTYTDAVRDERNFFAERAVIYSEGNTEPTVSTTTTDYTWREVLSSG